MAVLIDAAAGENGSVEEVGELDIVDELERRGLASRLGTQASLLVSVGVPFATGTHEKAFVSEKRK